VAKFHHPKQADAGKTKQQLLDELNSVRRQLSELEQTVPGAGTEPLNNSVQIEPAELRREDVLPAGTLDITGILTNAQLLKQQIDADPTHLDDAGEATVFIVDDEPSVRKAMGRLMKSAGYAVETFESAQAFLQREPYAGNGCLVVDLHMLWETGLDLQTTLNTYEYTMPIIFITGASSTSTGVRAMKQGAVDFLSKPVDSDELLRVVARAVETDQQARARYVRQVAAKEKLARLSARQGEIMGLVVMGMRSKQIAGVLGISERTVEAHRRNIMRKVGARSVTDLVRYSEIAANLFHRVYPAPPIVAVVS
jgi:FixJ family two-component response regulator